jgi:betaine reductase
MPILEDTLGCFAILVGEDDGRSPIVRLDAVGKHDIGAGSSQQAIMESLIVKPLERIGKKITDVDKYASELHNPEITVPSRSGDVPLQNYKIIAALAAQKKEIMPAEIPEFIKRRGMKGFAPTQGHIPAGVPYLGHAVKAIKEGKIKNAMFLARASLFLGRLSQLSDGVSFLIEKNPALDEKEKSLSTRAKGGCL